jgi:hypothetical protein
MPNFALIWSSKKFACGLLGATNLLINAQNRMAFNAKLGHLGDTLAPLGE